MDLNITIVEDLRNGFFWRAIFAELFGTAFFLFIMTSVVPLSSTFGGEKIVIVSFAVGLAIAVLVNNFGPISGAHLNPAVTLGVWVEGGISITKGGFYFSAQILGGILGSAVSYGLIPTSRHDQLGVVRPAKDMGDVQSFFVEMILTILLVLTVLSSTSEDNGRKDFGFANALAIGCSVTIAHMVGMPLTGSGINPARAFGPSLVTWNFHKTHWIYWIAPLLGGMISGLVYRFVLRKEEYKGRRDNESSDIKYGAFEEDTTSA